MVDKRAFRAIGEWHITAENFEFTNARALKIHFFPIG